MNKVIIILIAGIFLRLFLASSTMHSDLQAFYLGGKTLVEGKILNLYDYSSEQAIFNYPPPVYYFFGIFNFLSNWSLWLLKLPYLMFDLALGLLLWRLVKERKTLIFALWIFNPINLYATYMMGQFDIIPTFFTVLSFYFIAKNKLNLASFSLGFGIAFKLYPVFLIIPLLFLVKNFSAKIKLLLFAALPYAFFVFPYLSSASFRANALFASQASKSLYASIPVSGGESILLFPASLVLFYHFFWNKNLDRLNFWKIYSTPLLLFFIFTHYHPQWLIWLTPFLILDLSFNKFKNLLPISIIILTWFSSLFFFDPSLTVGMFFPLSPDLWTLLGVRMDYNFLRSIIQTVFAGSSLYLTYKWLKN